MRRATASAKWARADFRARWRSLSVLALLGALTGGFALAALAGARRTDTAFERLRARTNASDAIVFASQVGVFRPDWDQLAARPEVAALAPWFLAFGIVPGEPGEAVFMGSVDGRWTTTVDKPVVMHGRMFDPKASDEMVVDEDTAKQFGIKVGQVVPFHAYGAHQDDTSGQPPNGALLHLHVVGIVRATPQFLFTPVTMLSPGVLAAHLNDMLWLPNAMVRLRPGANEMAALQRDANRTVAPGTPVLDLRQAARRVTTTTNVEQSALLLLAIAVAAAGLVLVGQVLGRSASRVGEDAPTLRGIGMTRREIAAAGARSHIPVAIGAGAGAVIVAVIASRWFPVGLAARVDPDRGIHADWLVLAPGAILIAALIGSSAFLLAARAARPVRGRVTTGGPRRTLSWTRRNAPVSVGVGATMAFERTPGRTNVAVRPAIIGAVVGVLGVVGALTIEHGLRDALAHAERAGVTWQATILPHASDVAARGVAPSLLSRVVQSPHVRSAAVVERAVVAVNGVGVPTFDIRTQDGDQSAPIRFTVVSGRAPSSPGEAAIGPQTARDLHIGVGDTVTIGTKGSRVRITGRALFPSDVHATFDQGVWLPIATWDAVVPPHQPSSDLSSGPSDEAIAVRFTPGTDVDAATAQLGQRLGARADDVETAEVPVELENLRNVERLPEVLATFLALLAIAALAYLLVAIMRARVREFAILRALGFTRGQSRTVMASQSTAISVIGLLVGVPLGVLLGRLFWKLIAERVPLQNVPPFALLAVVVFVPAAVVAANLVALGPARRVARMRASESLRTE